MILRTILDVFEAMLPDRGAQVAQAALPAQDATAAPAQDATAVPASRALGLALTSDQELEIFSQCNHGLSPALQAAGRCSARARKQVELHAGMQAGGAKTLKL